MEKIKEWLSKKLPFVVYRKPNETVCFGWFQKDDYLHTLTRLEESCFVFAPFSGEEKVVFYPENCFLIEDYFDIEVDFSQEEKTLENPKVDKSFHINLVSKGIKAIQSNEIEKVVLSRQEEVEINEHDYELYFRRFLKKYPTAFVYWFYHPKVGMWMGATPEQLVKITETTIKTVALAATQVDQGIDLSKVVWGEKERQEQQIVTDFIVEALKPFSKKIYQTVPFTHRAGSLLHIKTDIEVELSSEKTAYDVIKALHPTPALCGFPKEKARDFILANEGYDRAYYGGFLGEWKFDSGRKSPNSDLFVNLRCMKIDGSKGYLFLGGGVNKDSNPESEYYETVNKSKTVKSIL
ncbi:MAG TPA: chorismate-binding protein [Flavobacterium sp.]|nr:chorismate-binding protein [Flavobacterium sp.]